VKNLELTNIRDCLYDILTAQNNLPELQANQNLSVNHRSADVKVFMVQNQVSQTINVKIVECLRSLDRVESSLLADDCPANLPAEIKEDDSTILLEERCNSMDEVLEDLTRIASIEKLSFFELKDVVGKAYLSKVFHSTNNNKEVGGVLGLTRSYVSKLLNDAGLTRIKGNKAKNNGSKEK